jgi:predicted DNA-binding transcriptional regulator AlpA
VKNHTLPAAEALSDLDVAALLSCSRRHVHTLAATPGFPVAIRLRRSKRWLRSEIDAWLRTKAERDTPPARRTRRS